MKMVTKIKHSEEVTCALLKKNIRVALNDYFKHVDNTGILDDVSDAFVTRLAEDATVSKRDLRNLLRKSPHWNENIQALVLSGTRPNTPDAEKINSLANKIFQPILDKIPDLMLREEATKYANLQTAVEFFSGKMKDEAKAEQAINNLVPKAYRKGKKKSRIFKALCDGLGVTDNTAGSDFQKNFTLLSDELSDKKQDFKLFVSINPAHFLTMSNPKFDARGAMMVSCHSFNTSEYHYNNGCSGYARDDVTMIAFTVANPDNSESLNNRKTSRQLFMYQAGGGVLLQSRLYTSQSGGSYGGVNGYQPDSELYREMIQQELARLENTVDNWQVSDYYKSNIRIEASRSFGGYSDWIHKEFAPKISVRADRAEDYIDDGTNASIKRPFKVGNAGLCVKCGEEIHSGLYCPDNEGCNKHCYHCENHSHLNLVNYNRADSLIYVCDECLNRYYKRCGECGEYFHVDELRENEDGRQLCRNCWEREHPRCVDCFMQMHHSEMVRLDRGEYVCRDCLHHCDECGAECHSNRTRNVYDADGNECHVCNACLREHYVRCENCEDYYHSDTSMYELGNGGFACEYCYENGDYAHCEDCGALYNGDDLHCVHNANGNDRYVCGDCFNHYDRCVECDEYYHEDAMYHLANGGAVCEHCFEMGDYGCCEECDGLYHYDDLRCAYNENGEPINVCCRCLEYHYELCVECDEWHHRDAVYELANGDYICGHCYSNGNYGYCADCDGLYHVNELHDVSDDEEHIVCENCAVDYDTQEAV